MNRVNFEAMFKPFPALNDIKARQHKHTNNEQLTLTRIMLWSVYIINTILTYANAQS